MGISLAAVLATPRARVGWTTNVPPAWDFDLPAIERAAVALGVTQPVAVGCANYARGRWGGMHSFERDEHRIRVARWLSPERASRLLWHELTHAAQRDRGEVMGTARVRREEGRDAYLAHPLEVEARGNEWRADDEPLVIA